MKYPLYKRLLPIFAAGLCMAHIAASHATLVSITNCGGAAISCSITTSPPNPVIANPNNDMLIAWDEVQNFTLTQDLEVDRVFDPNASFVTALTNGNFSIAAGTVVSSHYIQWDPDTAPNVGTTVEASIVLDSQVFGFITEDDTLLDSDFLGLANVNYGGFLQRGLEINDVTSFNGNAADIEWFAGNPGDWARLITAFSPSAPDPVSAPGILMMFSTAFGLVLFRRRK